MNRWDIKTLEDAFVYLADCQLATVVDLAMKKSKSKSEYERQILIAQIFCDYIKEFKLKDEGNRFEKVQALGNNVEKYAEQIEEKHLG